MMICRVAILQNLFHTFIHSRTVNGGIVPALGLESIQHERNAQHLAVGAFSCECAEEVEIVPGPQAKCAALEAMTEPLVILEVEQISGFKSLVVLQEHVHIIDSGIIVIPFGRERVAAHLRGTSGKGSPGSCLRTIQSIIRSSSETCKIRRVIYGRYISSTVSLVHETSQELMIRIEILIIVTSVRLGVQK